MHKEIQLLVAESNEQKNEVLLTSKKFGKYTNTKHF